MEKQNPSLIRSSRANVSTYALAAGKAEETFSILWVDTFLHENPLIGLIPEVHLSTLLRSGQFAWQAAEGGLFVPQQYPRDCRCHSGRLPLCKLLPTHLAILVCLFLFTLCGYIPRPDYPSSVFWYFRDH